MEFGVLGPISVVRDGHEVVFGSTREAALLADLLVHAGEAVRAGQLLEDVWRGHPPSAAAATLHTHIRGLRRRLEPGRASRHPGVVLLTDRSGYRLAVPPDALDSWRFERRLSDGRAALSAGEPDAAADHLGVALGLWRGRAFGDLATEVYLQVEAARLEELRRIAVEDLVDAELAMGRHALLSADLEGLVAEHPYRERRWAQWTLALYRSGRQADALQACQRVRRLLRDDLGLEPGAELQALEASILRHDPVLNLGPLARPPTPAAHASDRVASEGPHRVIDHRPRRHNLPALVTTFVGRNDELATVRGLVRAHRLVTLTGIGGVGKSRLAIEACAATIGEHPDGVWLIELAPVTDGRLLASTVAHALGLMTDGCGGPGDIVELVCRYLADREALLLLDNTEHLVDAVAPFVHRVLTTCPTIRILATSRDTQHLAGEVVYAVPPLSLPGDPTGRSDAVALFMDRARSANQAFEPTPASARAVADVCVRLEGIALAIELAAARTRTLDVHEIASRLDDCFAVLTSETVAGSPRRHRTLRQTFDWSYGLLTDDEQFALRRLAVFAGGFDLEAAVAIIERTSPPTTTDRDDGPVALLSRLVDRSLVHVVRTTETTRYRLLEPVRQYATERAADLGETDAARDRHRDIFLARSTDEWWPFLSAQQRRSRHDDRENLRAATDWCWRQLDDNAALRLVVAQTTSWTSVADYADAREWLERAVAATHLDVSPGRAQALATLALAVYDSGEPQRADHLVEQAIAVAAQLDDPATTAGLHLTIADYQISRGHSSLVRAALHTASTIYEHLDSPVGVGWCAHIAGWLAIAQDDHAGALAQFERSLTTTTHQDHPGTDWLLVHTLAALAPLTAHDGDPQRAVDLADQAVALAQTFPSDAVRAMVLVRATETSILAANYQRAETTLNQLVELLRTIGTRRWAADTLEMGGLILDHLSRPDDAWTALIAAQAIRHATGETDDNSRLLTPALRRIRRRLERQVAPTNITTDRTNPPTEPPELAMKTLHIVLQTPHPHGPTTARATTPVTQDPSSTTPAQAASDRSDRWPTWEDRRFGDGRRGT